MELKARCKDTQRNCVCYKGIPIPSAVGTEASYPHLIPWQNLLPKAAQDAYAWEDETKRRELKRIEERERRREKEKQKREEGNRRAEHSSHQMYFVSFGCVFHAAFYMLKFSRISLCLRNNGDGLAWQI